MHRSRFFLSSLVLAACAAPPPEPAETAAAPAAPTPGDLFVEAAAASGLDFVHFNGMTGELYYPEMMGSGAALFDYDNDGDLDVYFVQGAALGPGRPIFPPAGPLPPSGRLYRNDLAGDPPVLRFTDVTAESGLAAATGYGMGVAAADFDNDGWTDLYLTNLGANQLWRNAGGGAPTFTDVTAAAGVGDARWGVPAVAFDYDGDGWLDLFVGNYVEWTLAANPRCRDELGLDNYCGPLAFEPQPDVLYHNRGPRGGGARGGGGPVFADVTGRAGLDAAYGGALGAVAADFDGDGRCDLYVANDGMPNQLWINLGGGHFENRAVLAGAAVDGRGQAQASMGVAAADFDGDGDEDLFLTHLAKETNTVYVNDGAGAFEDGSVATGLGSPSWSATGFGTAWLDYDNDGWLDVLAVNGAVKVIKEQALAGEKLPLQQRNQLFHHRGGAGGAVYEEVTERAGAAFAASEVSRGAAFGDVDNDGDVDVVITNNGGPARLLLNQVGQNAHWLGLRLVTGERDAWGARATVTAAGGRELVRRVGATASYASASDPRLLFGLGAAGGEARVRVRWPDGAEEQWTGVEAGRYTTLRQGTGEPFGGGGP